MESKTYGEARNSIASGVQVAILGVAWAYCRGSATDQASMRGQPQSLS